MAVDPGAIAVSIPIVAVVCMTAVRIAKMFAPQGRPGVPPDLVLKVESMEEELATLRQELAETQERLDFTERMLAKPPEPTRERPPGS